MSATGTPANDPSTASSINESAELFEEENEQFIRSLEASDAKAPENTPETTVKQTLDDLLPDLTLGDEPKAEELAPAAPAAQPRAQQTDLAPPIPEKLSKLDQVKVNIKLEVGQVSCSLQKLLSLKEHDVIELNQPIGQVLDLRVDGRLIGKGQIVRLGDQLGLRISELAER